MLIGNILYFAPNIKFSSVDLSGHLIAQQYKDRIKGYYLVPAQQLVESKHGFASGLLIVCCIDALSRQRYPKGYKDRERFKKWVQKELKSFTDEVVANQLYDYFRNGLVHETRLIKGVNFSFEQSETVKNDTILTINPAFLLIEIENALNRYIDLIESDDGVKNTFMATLKKKFACELESHEEAI